jgi:hypothetical protein
MNHFTLKIGNQEIEIDSRFTLIQGKFKKNLLDEEQLKNFLKIIKTMDLIPVELITEIFEGKSTDYVGLHKSISILHYISNSKTIVDSNLKEFSNFSKKVEIFSQIIDYNYLLNKKESLTKEMEISRLSSQSSELSAIKDLISKLIFSIEKNKQKLRYFEEDVQNTKNQVLLLTKNIENITKKIDELTQHKKDCFNQINRITRSLEEDQDKTNSESIKKLGIDINLTNSEKIRALQKKAKDAQFEVSQLNSALNEAKNNYEKIKPEFESYMNDYQNIIQEIQKDKFKLDELNKEFKQKVINNNNYEIKQINQKEMQSIRPISTIEDEYNIVSEEIEHISFPEDFYNTEKPMKLDTIMNSFKEINHKIINNMKKYIIPSDEANVNEIMESLRKLDYLLNKLEYNFNSFLRLLNMESRFNLAISNNDEKLYIKINFYRKNKELISWNDFTTPEKIFSVIGIFISLKILLLSNSIIFSNLFLPANYNKRGSIFRTINKILPLFESNKNLSDINLIFVLSNLEMKNEIKNLKVLTIQES